MSTPQEYWDACLIRAWRNFNTFYDLNRMFHSITGEWPNDLEPRLLRTPKIWLPNKMGIRYYMAHFLPKINDRLLAQEPDKDVALLRKLKDSKYDSDTRFLRSDGEVDRDKVGDEMSVVKKINKHNSRAIAGRNEATDWGKVKGPIKQRRAR